jgi:DNA-binding CsgD family transcriptional regulator
MTRRSSARLHSIGPSGLDLGHADALALLEIIDGSVHCDTEERFRGLFSKLQSLLPFEHACAALGRRGGDGSILVKHFINVSCLDEFVAEMRSRDYMCRSALSREHFATYRLKFWSEARRSLGQPREFVALAKDLGMRDGYTVGVSPLRSVPSPANGSMFCLSVRTPRRDERTERLLGLVVPHLHAPLCRLGEGDRGGARGVVLSAREKEVLRLLAQGKSSWEMSVIIGISESTVNYHVYNVMRKLEAVNRPQTVAVAASLGLVEIV